MKTPNTQFFYIYRDASNYKKLGSVIFSGKDPDVVKKLTESFQGGENFIASQVRVPEVFLFESEGYSVSDDDHCWHQFSEITEVEASADDEHCRTFSEFIKEVQSASAEGWVEFAPVAR